MLCPACNIQMTQKDKIGGGVSNETEYTTWELKECRNCGRLVKEFYTAVVIRKVRDLEKLERLSDLKSCHI